MKFFHVYNEACFKGLEKNGLLNADSGFKIQHCFAVPRERQFNNIAAVGGKLHSLIREGHIPFYVDRIAGGITYYPYTFDRKLIAAYRELLGDWFLGFQMHESASNRRGAEWPRMIKAMGSKGPYDAAEMRRRLMSTSAVTADGEYLVSLSHDTPEYYAKRTYAETIPDFVSEVREMFQRRLDDTDGNILPCDSFYLFTKLQNEMGMRTFMPEVGCQIPMMRIAMALARGMARANHKTWGAYYECWRSMPDGTYCMPCFNSDPINEWYLTQETHTDDFTSFGPNGGSSRLLQNRIYHHALMSGADYFSEEWGLNCSYTDMQDFSLSAYGQVKKDFIRTAETLRGIRAVTPFAVVLPREYICVELPGTRSMDTWKCGLHRDQYMRTPLTEDEKAFYGHIEDVLKRIYSRVEMKSDSEAHVLTNSRMGDLFDIVYEDTDEAALAEYAYLIDASPDGAFARSTTGRKFKTLESADPDALERQIHRLAAEQLPCIADGLDWLVSEDENGQRYLSLFNNEGNERYLDRGDVLDHQMDRWVTVRFREEPHLRVIASSGDDIEIRKADAGAYRVFVPAAGFAVLAF